VGASALALAVGGCGGSDRADAPQGRSLGASARETDKATAAAVNYVSGLLRFRAGKIPASKVPNAQPAVRRALEQERIPPGLKTRATESVGAARLTAWTPTSASVDVTVTDRGRSTYTLPIVLTREPGGVWLASEAGRE
jgi:hypothetical protein